MANKDPGQSGASPVLKALTINTNEDKDDEAEAPPTNLPPTSEEPDQSKGR